MKSYSVYMHTCPNSKKYIGITCRNPIYRWNHGNGYRRNEHFFRAIVKYGWDNIKHEILFDGLTEEEACAIEVELIAKYKSNDARYGYNKDNGGFTGCKISERTKAKMSDAHKWQIRDAAYRQHIAEAKMCEKNPMYGKCGELHHNSKTVFQKTKNGETIRMFKCVSDAERCLGLPHGAFKNISACALGKKKTAYGFVWCYYE